MSGMQTRRRTALEKLAAAQAGAAAAQEAVQRTPPAASGDASTRDSEAERARTEAQDGLRQAFAAYAQAIEELSQSALEERTALDEQIRAATAIGGPSAGAAASSGTARPAAPPTAPARADAPDPPVADRAPASQEPAGSSIDQFDGNSRGLEEFIRQLHLRFFQQPTRFASERSKVLLTLGQLRGTAATWSSTIVARITTDALPPEVQTFEIMKALLRKQFGDPVLAERNERWLLDLMQTSTVKRYAEEFMQLRVTLPQDRWPESALVHQFRAGLRRDIRTMLISRERATTVADLTQQAYDIEEQLQDIAGSAPVPAQRDTRGRDSILKSRPKCFLCQKVGHVQAYCPDRFGTTRPFELTTMTLATGPSARTGDRPPTVKACNQCGSTTHLKRHCTATAVSR